MLEREVLHGRRSAQRVPRGAGPPCAAHGRRVPNRDRGRRDGLLRHAAVRGCELPQRRRPRRVQRPEHGGQVEARRGGAAPVRRDRPRHADVRARRLQDARLPGRHGVRQRGVLHARRMYVRRGAGHHDRRREDGARRGSRGQGVHYPFRHRGRPCPHRRLSRSPRGLPRRA